MRAEEKGDPGSVWGEGRAEQDSPGNEQAARQGREASHPFPPCGNTRKTRGGASASTQPSPPLVLWALAVLSERPFLRSAACSFCCWQARRVTHSDYRCTSVTLLQDLESSVLSMALALSRYVSTVSLLLEAESSHRASSSARLDISVGL